MKTRFVNYPAVIGMAMILVAATPQGQDREKSTSQGFVLKAGEHSLLKVIHNAATFLGRNYLTNDEEFANSPTITLDKTLNLDAFGCEEVVSQLAYSRDFAMTAVDAERGIYEFLFVRGPRRPEIFLRAQFVPPEEIRRRTRLKMVVATAVRLERASASRVVNSVRPLLAGIGAGVGGVQIGTGGHERTVLLLGFADQLAAALRMRQEVDKNAEAAPGVSERLDTVERRLAALEKHAAPGK